MKLTKKTSLALVVGAALSALAAASASAATYDYMGNPFSSSSSPYSDSDAVTGTVTLSSPLPDNASLFTPSVVSYQFTDGVQTITPTDNYFASFAFSTDLTGAITAWIVNLCSDLSCTGNGNQITTISFGPSPNFSTDSVILASGASANNTDNPGVWSSAAVATPLPAALPLFVSGLGALGLLGWRRKRKAAVLAAA